MGEWGLVWDVMFGGGRELGGGLGAQATNHSSLSQSVTLDSYSAHPKNSTLPLYRMATTESQLILQLTQQVALALSSPITLYTWPLYAFEAVSDASTILTQPEKESLNSMIASQISATIDALLRANTVVDNWIEVEVESVWKRIRRWCCCQAKCGTARCAPERQAL